MTIDMKIIFRTFCKWECEFSFFIRPNLEYQRGLTGNESIKYPTAGFAKIYKIGRMDVMRPITSGEMPRSLPKTLICGKIGPIAVGWKLTDFVVVGKKCL